MGKDSKRQNKAWRREGVLSSRLRRVVGWGEGVREGGLLTASLPLRGATNPDKWRGTEGLLLSSAPLRGAANMEKGRRKGGRSAVCRRAARGCMYLWTRGQGGGASTELPTVQWCGEKDEGWGKTAKGRIRQGGGAVELTAKEGKEVGEGVRGGA